MALSDPLERHFRGAADNRAAQDHGDCGWAGVVSHAGSRLRADLADVTTLTRELAGALDGVRGPWPRHDPGDHASFRGLPALAITRARVTAVVIGA